MLADRYGRVDPLFNLMDDPFVCTILCFSGLDWKECAHSSFYYSGIFNVYDVDVNSKFFALAVVVVFAVRCLHG